MRAQVLTELLVELDSVRGLELLSAARAAISLRMQELIDERGFCALEKGRPIQVDVAEVLGEAMAKTGAAAEAVRRVAGPSPLRLVEGDQ